MSHIASVYNQGFYDAQVTGSVRSAQHVFEVLVDLLGVPGSVVDVGCGRGGWLLELQRRGVSRLRGLDGPWVDRDQFLVDAQLFSAIDLEAEHFAAESLCDDDRFDLLVSMEVAEHISPGKAESFVSNLCLLSDTILFSAAIPQQGGTNHVNEQWPAYWAKIFRANRFFCFDILRPRLWNNDEVQLWYAQNALLFLKQDTSNYNLIRRTHEVNHEPLALVHPKLYRGVVWNWLNQKPIPSNM